MAIEKHEVIERALLIIQRTLGSLIISSNWDLEGGKLSFLLKNGIMIYIGYNSVGQYAYQVMKSLKQREFIRFDNFDDRWDVSTKPHHFHPFKMKQATVSPMVGIPERDLPLLCRWILLKRIFESDFDPISEK